MDDPSSEVVVLDLGPETEASTAAYWTQRRMDEAVPLPVPSVTDHDITAWDVMFPEADEVVAPDRSAGERAEVVAEDESVPSSGYVTRRVPQRSVMPFAAVGKLFMTMNGGDFVATAWTVADKGVFTAGHCIFDSDRGGFASNVLFVPQFHKGKRPVGTWSARFLVASSRWTNKRDFAHDLGGFIVDRPIAPITGRLGWVSGRRNLGGPFVAIGYPAERAPKAPFDGLEMWLCGGDRKDWSGYLGMRNNMTGGSSGGPWRAVVHGEGLVCGLNSFSRAGHPEEMYSPRFGKHFVAIIKRLERGA